MGFMLFHDGFDVGVDVGVKVFVAVFVAGNQLVDDCDVLLQLGADQPQQTDTTLGDMCTSWCVGGIGSTHPVFLHSNITTIGLVLLIVPR